MRIPILLLLTWMATLPAASDARAQGSKIELTPANPTPAETITFRLSGVWPNGCVPRSPAASISSSVIRIETSNPGQICAAALTPWTLTGTIGRLAAGDYTVIAGYSGPSVPSAVEIARKSFSVSSSLTEVILPVVTNGALSEKAYYQTIFTLLNAGAEAVRGTLQVYNNNGVAAGAFCSPLAPPPSSLDLAMKPGAQVLQFTSADLQFLDGWAAVRWNGPSALLASEEITLGTGTPPPCLLVCNKASTEKLSSTQLQAVIPARQFRIPVTINPYRQTALALVNPSTAGVLNVKVSILDASGDAAILSVPATFEVAIPPMHRVSRFLWQMAAEHSPLAVILPVPESFQGSVMLMADAPFAAAALNIMYPEGKFVSTPGISVPAP